MLNGKTALVTGSTSGIGLGIARALAGQGANVVLNGFGDAGEIERLRAGFESEFGVRAIYAPADVSKPDEIAAMIAKATSEMGGVDILVNNAGIQHVAPIQDFPIEKWDAVIAINLTGCMLTARHAVPLMRKTGGGAMVHFSSTQCLRGDDRPQDAYQVAKAGILALSKSIAIQFAADQIRSNVILPSATESPMQARWQQDPELKRATAAGVPLGRVGTTQDMANACLFLLSDAASFITGTELLVDGGRMALP